MTNTMSYKGYSARIEYDDDDGIFTGRVAGIRDGVGFHADTVGGLREAFYEAVEDYLETCAVDSERIIGRVAFRRSWLQKPGLTADQCSVIRVVGESMEPTLPDGCSILVNRAQREPRLNGIFVLRTHDGLLVKRAGKDEAGEWLLVSDHPAWEPAAWPDTAEVVGEVRWMAREL